MMVRLVLRSLAAAKIRFATAVLGIAAAGGLVIFMFSLAATNAAQAPRLAEQATAPWQAWRLERPGERRASGDLNMVALPCTLDMRPGGRVLQGPPMRVTLTRAPHENPYPSAPLVAGRWIDEKAPGYEVVCTEDALLRFGRGTLPKLGSSIKILSEKGTLSATLVGYLKNTKLPMNWPNVFANKAAFDGLATGKESRLALWKDKTPPRAETCRSPSVTQRYTRDEAKRMDYARPLMLIASVLTALSLLVHALLLSVEANRRAWATLRIIGMTRLGVWGFVLLESLLMALAGWGLGLFGAWGALRLYVAADVQAFPTGAVFAFPSAAVAGAMVFFVALLASGFALRPALMVRPLDARARLPRPCRYGMALAFGCGFAAFVAVEVWGASLMRAFVPSPQWPDAIVSLLPEGADPFDIEKLRKIDGIARISELYPLQLDLYPREKMDAPLRGGAPRRRTFFRNALFLAAEWLPEFRFVEGSWRDAESQIRTSDACVITEMMSRARGLHKGDTLSVVLGGRGGDTVVALPIAGVVDLNWHMVTSRGLVRGLNGASGMTDGPVFVSLDTLENLDPRPDFTVRMTHMWVSYDPAALARHGVFPLGRKIEKAIAEALDLQGPSAAATVRLHARDEIADGTLAHGSDIIGQVARIPFVFLAILAIGFVAMLVAHADAEKRLFAVLRAVGATRGQLIRRLTWRALKTAGVGMLWGTPVGALAGWLFSLGTGNWPGLPRYFVFPARLVAEGALGALLLALLFSLPAAMWIIQRETSRNRHK